MAVTMLDSVEFNKIPALQFVIPVVAADPTGYEAGLIYNSTTKEIKYHNGTTWVALGPAGAGGPPTGAASGDLTGSYPSPQIAAGVIVDADISASAAIATSKISGLDTALTGKASTATDLTAGAGLTGGGTIAANRTFNVGAGTGITVNADDVAVNRTVTDTWYQAAGSSGGNAGGDLSGTYPNPQIAAGVIVDADVNAAANIAQSKISGLTTSLAGKADTTTTVTAGAGLVGGGTLAANRTLDIGAGTGITVNADDVAINRTTVDTWYVDTGGDTMTGLLTLSADPTNPLHAATKQYVDLTAQGLSFKNAVRVATTANLTLSGTQTIDGVACVVGDRVLAMGMTTASQNGIYVVASGAWSRATDMDATGELKDGTVVPVAEGTLWADSLQICTAVGATPWVPNSSSSTWTKFTSMSDLVAGAGLTKTGNQIDFVAGNSTLTVAADSVTVASAPKWSTGQTITLTGEVTGVSAAWDGSAGISFATAIAAGVIVDADINASANIAQSKISGLSTSLSGKVDTTRSVIAGNGLTGGGTLATDATLNVVGDATLSVTADQVAVVSAPKWTTGRTITLTGDVTGTSAAFDGSGNLSIATTAVGTGTAAKHFAGDVPAGTSCAITHNLGTRDVTVTVYRNSSPWDTVLCDSQRTDTNTVTLKFASAVSAGQFRCVVQGR